MAAGQLMRIPAPTRPLEVMPDSYFPCAAQATVATLQMPYNSPEILRVRMSFAWDCEEVWQQQVWQQ